jgi:hypothetical protein
MYSKWFIKLFRGEVKASFISLIGGILLTWVAYSATQIYRMFDSDLRWSFLRISESDQTVINFFTGIVLAGGLMHIHGYCDAINKLYMFRRISVAAIAILMVCSLCLWQGRLFF